MYFLKEDKNASDYAGAFPFISILIAARNEEANIRACLQSIEALSWPSEQMEVLIGNDQSTDGTVRIVREYIKHKRNFRLIQIEENHGTAKGKANVLAVLAKEAKGDFFFMTDADIRVSKKWIQSLLANHDEKIGIVSGVTRMEENSLFDYCQAVDWVYGFSMIKVASDSGIPVSAVGNNMMITAKAYRSTGGYENIPFSVTEDHALFVATLKQGWGYKNLMSFDNMASTKPVASLATLLAQRKRWMQGAVKVPFVLLFFLFIQSLFLPVLLVSIFYFPLLGLIGGVVKMIFQQIFLVLSFKRIRLPYSVFKGTILYECYAGLLSPMMLVNYCIPTKVKWKGRAY